MVQNKIKCLGVDLDGKAVFAGALLETCSQLQTSNGARDLPEPGCSVLHKPLNPKLGILCRNIPIVTSAMTVTLPPSCANVDSANVVNMGVKVL